MPDNIWIGDCPAKGPSECAPEWSWAWDGLVGLWAPALGPTGNALFDLSGRSNHGTMQNMDPATDWVGSPGGWALDFDGSDDFVEIGVSNVYLPSTTQPLTVLIQALPSSISDGDYAERVFTVRRTTKNQSALLLGFDNLSKAFYFNGASRTEIASGISVGTWCTLGVTYSGNSSTTWFNGAQATSPDGASLAAAGGSVYRARIGAGPEYQWYHGAVSACGVWHRALSAEEVRAWTADPFALLRPVGFSPELWYSGGAPPAGSSIPAIYDYYRRLRCA
jgi:hypothetical protein